MLKEIHHSLSEIYVRNAPTGRGGYQFSRALARLCRAGAEEGIYRNGWGVSLGLTLSGYPDFAMATGAYELETVRVLRRVLDHGGTFVDVGANIGYFSILAARQVGREGKVIAIEPDPINRERLMRNLQLNNLVTQVVVESIAAGSERGTAVLMHPSGPNHGLASLYGETSHSENEFSVSVQRLDSLHVARPDVVKMDIEGGELEALIGMKKWLAGDRPPVVVFEYNPIAAQRARYTLADLLGAFRGAGGDWSFYRTGRGFGRSPLDEDVDLGQTGKEVNIVAVPESRRGLLSQ